MGGGKSKQEDEVTCGKRRVIMSEVKRLHAWYEVV